MTTLPLRQDRVQRSLPGRILPGRSSVTAGDDRTARSQCDRCRCSFTSTAHPVHPEPRPQRPRHRLTKTQDQSQEKVQRMLGKPGTDLTEPGSEHVPCPPPRPGPAVNRHNRQIDTVPTLKIVDLLNIQLALITCPVFRRLSVSMVAFAENFQ